LEDNRDELMKSRELEGQIDVVDRRRDKLLTILDDDPMPEIAAALKKANAERAALVEQKAVLDQAAVHRLNLSRSREALLTKIDLTGNTARMEANNVLRRLGISVEIQRQDPHILYTVKQQGTKILQGRQIGDKVPLVAYTKEGAIRAYELGDTLWPELAIDKPFKRTTTSKRPELTLDWPGADWSAYNEPLHEHDYEDEYTPTGE
jgi:hypothetical protein